VISVRNVDLPRRLPALDRRPASRARVFASRAPRSRRRLRRPRRDALRAPAGVSARRSARASASRGGVDPSRARNHPQLATSTSPTGGFLRENETTIRIVASRRVASRATEPRAAALDARRRAARRLLETANARAIAPGVVVAAARRRATPRRTTRRRVT
jgi:hypothetical protein